MAKAFVAPTPEEFEASKAWGLLTSIDIHDCNPVTIRDADAIRRFTRELCDRLLVKRFGDTQVVEFGDEPRVHGYSMTQLIETSLVSAHFAEETNSVYLDVFSCRHYNAAEAVDFACQFFEGRYFEALSVLRGCVRQLPESYCQELEDRNVILQPDSRGDGKPAPAPNQETTT